jgi:imidazolonepropionase-like amidohydrolase
VSDRPLDAEFLSLAKRQGTLYCPTITVFGGYARGYRAAATGEAPEIDDPTSAVDSLTRAHVLGTARLARAEAGARSLVRRSRLDSLERLSRANTLAAFRAGIPIVLGTDAGNPLTLHGPAVFAELEALERSGLRPMDVLVAGTRNAARALGRGSDLGTVVPGRHADLLLLAADPTRSASAFRRIRSVVRGGELKSVAELSAAVRRSRE